MADDPVAEFLAREKAELGDITTELGNGNSSGKLLINSLSWFYNVHISIRS